MRHRSLAILTIVLVLAGLLPSRAGAQVPGAAPESAPPTQISFFEPFSPRMVRLTAMFMSPEPSRAPARAGQTSISIAAMPGSAQLAARHMTLALRIVTRVKLRAPISPLRPYHQPARSSMSW